MRNGRRRYAPDFTFDNDGLVPEKPRLLMRTAPANSSCNFRLATPAMWSFAVLEIGKRRFTMREQERP